MTLGLDFVGSSQSPSYHTEVEVEVEVEFKVGLGSANFGEVWLG